MTEERQCYYIVREGGSVSCYLKDGYNHRVLADTLDVAERQQLIESQAAQLIAARAQVAEWQLTGDAIMQCALGRIAPLSDSDVCGVITELRATVEQLQAQLRERNEDVARLQRRVKECDQIVASGEAERKALATLIRHMEDAARSIMQSATGNDEPLSAFKVCGVIAELRNHVQDLEAQLCIMRK